MKCGKGFTLIELMLVVIIMGVIAGVGIPNFSRTFSGLELKKTADDIVSLVRYAQSQAAAEHKIYKLEFTYGMGGYQLTRAGINEDGEVGEFEGIKKKSGRLFKVPASVKVEGEPSIRIYPDGTLDPVAIRLSSPSGALTLSSREQRGYVFILNDDK